MNVQFPLAALVRTYYIINARRWADAGCFLTAFDVRAAGSKGPPAALVLIANAPFF